LSFVAATSLSACRPRSTRTPPTPPTPSIGAITTNGLSPRWVEGIGVRSESHLGLFIPPEVAHPIEENRQQDGAADEAALPEGVYAEETEAVADHFDESSTDNRA